MSLKAVLIVIFLLRVSELTLVRCKPADRKGMRTTLQPDPQTIQGRRPNRQELFPRDCGHSHVQNKAAQNNEKVAGKKIKYLKSGRTKRVVGGQESLQGEWPWQVALLFNGGQYCGGSLVNNDWVVTAAHCFNPFSSSDPINWTIIIGDHHLENREPFEQRRKVKSITIHPRYKSMWFEGIFDTPPKFDVAVMELEKKVSFEDHIQPVCLYRPDLDFHTGEECWVVGWGHTKWGGSKPAKLNYAKVSLISKQMCNSNKSYNGTIHDTALCAGFPKGGIDSCEYDSGGGLVCKRCDQYYLLGLVSWGHECARPWKFGVYTNMVVLTTWVQETIRNIVAKTERQKLQLNKNITKMPTAKLTSGS